MVDLSIAAILTQEQAQAVAEAQQRAVVQVGQQGAAIDAPST